MDNTEQAVPWARCGFLSLFPTSTIVLVLSCNSENIDHDGTRLAFAVLDYTKSLLPLEQLRLRWLMLTSTHGTSIPSSSLIDVLPSSRLVPHQRTLARS